MTLSLFASHVFTKYDIGTAEENEARHYSGFGPEGIGILKKYRAIPLGSDLRKPVQYAGGESTDREST